MSIYVKLASYRKHALFQGEEKEASVIFKAMQKLAKSGTVSEEEFKAAAYL
jgi:hypothetical protein